MHRSIRTRTRLVAGALAALVLTACSGGSPPQPLTGLTAGAWNWVDFPGTSCSDGSPTGIGVNPGTGPDLVFFLDGGGACASGLTCFVLGTATLGPFGRTQFEARVAEGSGTILDRALPGNPYADATLVFVPYCTGDVHGGDRVVTYSDVTPARTMHHTGHSNLMTFVARVAATWPTPRRLVLSGSSAGGFGTLVNYDAVRRVFPAAAGFAVDDSGPGLEGSGGALIEAGIRTWGIAPLLDAFCGPGACEADLSLGLPALARLHPADRFALLSWSDDPTITRFYVMAQGEFPARLQTMIRDRLTGLGGVRTFVASGSAHTLLGDPTVSAGGVTLVGWLAQQVSNDPAWASVGP